MVGKKRPRRDTKVTRRGRNREEANYHCDLTAEAKILKIKAMAGNTAAPKKRRRVVMESTLIIPNSKPMSSFNIEKTMNVIGSHCCDFLYNF